MEARTSRSRKRRRVSHPAALSWAEQVVIKEYLLEEGLIAQLSALAAAAQSLLIQRYALYLGWGGMAQSFHLNLIHFDGPLVLWDTPVGLAEACLGSALQSISSLCLLLLPPCVDH